MDFKEIVYGGKSVGEAKYRALAQGVTRILWLKSLFSELGYSFSGSPVLWCEKTLAKSIGKNPVFHSQTNHIEIDIHFVRENVENGDVDIRYLPSEY